MVENKMQCKLVLLGDSGVGKSSIVLRFAKNIFHENNESTIGAAFHSQSIRTIDGTVKFEIWDTAGQERYHSLAPMYYRGAQIAVVVYDVSNLGSFEKAKGWIIELRAKCNKDIKTIAFVGNKIDTPNPRVNTDEAKKFATDNGLIFWQTSAKSNKNIMELFTHVAREILTKTDMNSSIYLASSQKNDTTYFLEADDNKSWFNCCYY